MNCSMTNRRTNGNVERRRKCPSPRAKTRPEIANIGGGGGLQLGVNSIGDTPTLKLTPAGNVVQAAPGGYDDTSLMDRSGTLVISETEKKLYFRYKDSGGVCHSIELGGPYT